MIAWDRVTLILSIVVTGWFVTLPIEAPTNTTIGNGHLGSDSDVAARNREVRFTPESGLKSDIRPCPFCADFVAEVG